MYSFFKNNDFKTSLFGLKKQIKDDQDNHYLLPIGHLVLLKAYCMRIFTRGLLLYLKCLK